MWYDLLDLKVRLRVSVLALERVLVRASVRAGPCATACVHVAAISLLEAKVLEAKA